MTISSTICIIPARGGSKRIPGKNVRPLLGKPLLAYTIEAAVHSDAFQSVVVSSDDQAILDVAREYGAAGDRRPEHLAGDKTKAVEVVSEFLYRPGHGMKWDAVAMCLPTCPFRTAEDIRAAHTMFKHNASDVLPRLLGVAVYEFPPQLALEGVAGTNRAIVREPGAYACTTRSQDCVPHYYPNGSIYLSSVEAYIRTETFFVEPLMIYVMPAERSFDIDYEYQFRLAECMLRNQIRKEE